MWVAKFSIPYNEQQLLGSLTKTHNIKATIYPVTHSFTNKKLIVVGTGLLEGDQKNINAFVSDLKKDKRTYNIEMKNNLFIFEACIHSANIAFFKQGIMHTAPVMIDSSGENVFHFASWTKKNLSELLDSLKIFRAKIIYIKQQSVPKISIIQPFPNLTEKQRTCFRSAIDNGYFDVPKRTDMDTLAKQQKVSSTTYQFHLQRAQKKIIDFVKTIL